MIFPKRAEEQLLEKHSQENTWTLVTSDHTLVRKDIYNVTWFNCNEQGYFAKKCPELSIGWD